MTNNIEQVSEFIVYFVHFNSYYIKNFELPFLRSYKDINPCVFLYLI